MCLDTIYSIPTGPRDPPLDYGAPRVFPADVPDAHSSSRCVAAVRGVGWGVGVGMGVGKVVYPRLTRQHEIGPPSPPHPCK